jgi:zinc finger CCCH domain-containing protein 13
MHPSSELANGHGGPGAYAMSKGSRFAKFFDGKSKEGPASIAKAQNAGGFQTSSPGPGQKHEASSFGGITTMNGENRAMDDIFAMLSNSTQVYGFCLRPRID